MLRKLFLFGIIMFFLSGCQKEFEDSKNFSLKYENSLDSKRLYPEFDSVFTNIMKVRFSKSEDYFITEINKVFFSDENIIIVDKKGNQILRFDNSGKFENKIGNYGEGPGEYSSITSVHLFDDSLFVWDYKNIRLSKFTINGKYLTSKKLNLATDFVLLKDSKICFYNAFINPDSDRNIFTLYSKDGELIKSFGKPFYPMDGLWGNIAIDNIENIYCVHPFYFGIKKFNKNGNYIGEIGIKPKGYVDFEKGQGALYPMNEMETKIIVKKVYVGNKIILLNYMRNSPYRDWIDIYNIKGKLIYQGIVIPGNMFLRGLDKNDNLIFRNLNEIESGGFNSFDLEILVYSLKENILYE